MVRLDLSQSLPWLLTVALLVGSGVVQGRITGRWAPSLELKSAVDRINQMPLTVGTWQGQDGDPDLATLKRAGISGGILRRFHDSVTGANLTAMLVCGRPGPISVHTPEVCYQGAGYQMASPPSEPIPGFFAAKMIRPDVAIPDCLQVYWSWNAGDGWSAPKNPRLEFGAKPFLYKLYIVRSINAAVDTLDSGPAVDFTKALIEKITVRAPNP